MHLSNNYGHLCLEEIRITFQHSGVLYHRMSPVTEVIVLKYELAYRTLPMRLPCCGSWREVTSVEPSSPFTQTSVCFIFPSSTQLFDQTNTLVPSSQNQSWPFACSSWAPGEIPQALTAVSPLAAALAPRFLILRKCESKQMSQYYLRMRLFDTQRYSTFLAPGISLVGDNFCTDRGLGGWFWNGSSTLHVLCTLFLVLLHCNI